MKVITLKIGKQWESIFSVFLFGIHNLFLGNQTADEDKVLFYRIISKNNVEELIELEKPSLCIL